ncbi:MAG: hypothetical protein KAS66_04035 [Candidatus Omnitrophica bacterium]|nr:hypothetical protein [Candidatus Omnitrophota bacterium]
MGVGLRYEVFSLSEDLEMEMRQLEQAGLVTKGKSWSWMKKELAKARSEVDKALEENRGLDFVTKASLHEAMILSLMREYLNNTDPVWTVPGE